MVFAKISQVAHYTPDQVVSNDDLAEIMDTSDEWISSRTGSYDVTFQEMRRLAIWQQWWHKDCWQKQI